MGDGLRVRVDWVSGGSTLDTVPGTSLLVSGLDMNWGTVMSMNLDMILNSF